MPRATVRPSPSAENLHQPAARPSSVINPRLRHAPSRDHLAGSIRQPPRTAAPLVRRERETSSSSISHTSGHLLKKSSSNVLFKQPSKPVLSEQDEVHRGLGESEDIQKDRNIDLVETESNSTSKKSRQSLSERTMDTLQNIPSSPALRKRDSFFNPESPMRTSSRPGSSSQESAMGPPGHSFSMQPTSSENDNSFPSDFRASTNTFRQPSTQTHTPGKRPSTSKSFQTPSSSQSSRPASRFASPRDSTSSPVKTGAKVPPVKSGSQTVSARHPKARASASSLLRKASMPAMDESSELDRIGFGAKKPATFSNTSSEGASTISKASKSTTTTVSPDQSVTSRKSSSGLRDQIAKAKAAKRAAATKSHSSVSPSNEDEVPVIPSGTFDFGLPDDPFNQNGNRDGAKGLLRKRIDAARTDGRLNIAALGFKEMPDEIMNMYNLETLGDQGGSWAESVDLTRFVAADNEFEVLGDNVFPDIDPREAMDDEDIRGNQFGGLETLDLHGNVLISLPPGLRRLEFLTTLNLVSGVMGMILATSTKLLQSNNKLSNDCFEVITQIPSLRDLKLANNGLSGSLDARISKLYNLEVLDMQCNSLASLPEGLAELIHLRILNINENSFDSLPFEVLCELPLIELQAAKNKLSGSLINNSVHSLPRLQILNVTSNALTNISMSGQIDMPALHQIGCSSNRLTSLPDMTSWTSLLTLAAEDNNITEIPEGFSSLPKIKNVDFSGNNLKILDDRIGAMDSLDILRISGNPLREKRFAGMSTDDLKKALKARMEPVEQVDAPEDGAFYSAQASPTTPRPSSADWAVKAGGVLDRSNTRSHTLNPLAAAHVAATNAIKVLELHHNLFKEIPSSIAFFAATLTSLSLAHNELTAETFLSDDLELPALKELNLSSNTFHSVQPLINHLKAPLLERLDISFNRLTYLVPLKPYFPKLWTLLASNNTIRELSPDSVKGLRVLDCSSNELTSLNARIGLLGGPGGLERLDVSGNRFRVPKYTILEKGTEATLSWLRDRIPAGETNSADVD